MIAGFAAPAIDRSRADIDDKDIVDEAINLFRFNCFCKSFECRGPADRTLVYLSLIIGDVLSRVQFGKTKSASEALNQLQSSPVLSSRVSVPGDAQFPLDSAMFPAAKDGLERDRLCAYLSDLRLETAKRLLHRIFAVNSAEEIGGSFGANPWWAMFSKRKFMNKSLCQ